jgi:LPS sulfotransferase NodH
MRLPRLFQSRPMQGFSHLRSGDGDSYPKGLLETVATPGAHERSLREMFGDRMGFDGTSPVFAQPLMLIAFTNRSGSNLVCDYVAQSGQVGGAGEFLNHDVVASQRAKAGSEIASLPDYIVYLHQTLVGPKRMLALKASWDQLAMLLRHNILAMFQNVIVLHCVRVDTLQQAVSYAIALRSGRWTQLRQDGQPDTDGPELAEAHIPLEEIEAQMDTLHRANLLIRLLCEAHGLKRWEVGYERLCNDKGAHLVHILQASGLVPPEWKPGAPNLERQAGPLNLELSAALMERFRMATAIVHE